MRTTSFSLTVLTVALSLIGCSGSDGDLGNPLGVGGAVGPGGSSSTGGSLATGGNRPGQGGATGGAQQSNGGSGVGGSQATGGSQSTGGSAQSGGSPATGGVQSSGGATATGGRSATGGRAAGGVSQTGGAVATGGSNANGGASTGGKAATGGATAAGGAATGGKAATGGATATGGAATGGAPAAGGSAALPKFVGNITTGNSVNPSGLTYSKYWDQLTPENAGKWGSVQSTPTSAMNWASLDAFYNYTQTNTSVVFKQHTFVWGAQQPSGTPTLAQVENWIKSFCTRYPNTKLIDVVNEPPPHTTPTYTANLGAGESGTYPWITKAFKLARQYCPNAILLLNDYNNIEYADQEQHFIDIVKDIKANGAPIDAVGCQAHGLKGRSTAEVQTNVNKMATDTALPVYITEYDIGDASDSVQLTNFQNHFAVFLNTASVKGITIWGWINGSTWISNSGIVNGTAPRSSMTWLMGQLGRPVPPN